jgi:ferredoxin|tara:strand:- start:11732 stop:11992 length:261 start_codon:yes stop_codon:yes gene_type:complete
MGKYIVRYDRIGCIGAAACAAALPEVWDMDEEAKGILIGGKKIDEEKDIWEREIEEDELEANLEAAKACPVVVIQIINKETGERLI